MKQNLHFRGWVDEIATVILSELTRNPKTQPILSNATMLRFLWLETQWTIENEQRGSCRYSECYQIYWWIYWRVSTRYWCEAWASCTYTSTGFRYWIISVSDCFYFQTQHLKIKSRTEKDMLVKRKQCKLQIESSGMNNLLKIWHFRLKGILETWN